MDPIIGQFSTFGFSFALRDWQNCGGQLIQIQQNTALYSLLGVSYEEIPTNISLLGEEIGSILLHTVHSEGKIPNKIGDYLQLQKLTSTRGNLRFTTYNESMSVHLKFEFSKKNDIFQNTVIETLHSSISEVIN